MTNDPLHYLTIESASELIAKKDLSPVELTEALLARIADVDGALGAYVTSMADEAMAMAKIAESEIAVGNYKGPLHGIPVAFKDLFDTKGVRTTASSKVMEHYVPTEDATVVARLDSRSRVFLWDCWPQTILWVVEPQGSSSIELVLGLRWAYDSYG